jgi:hypothetical protein
VASSKADANVAAGAGEAEDGYIEDAGPGFDPREQITTELPPLGEEQLVATEPLERWEEDTVRAGLDGAGEAVHLMIGVGESDWKMTQADLDRIAPPLTRIMNRYEPIAQLAPYADPLLVAQGAAQYAFRSMVARRAALAAREQAFEGYAVDTGEPIAGQPAGANAVEQDGYVPFAHRTRPQEEQ